MILWIFFIALVVILIYKSTRKPAGFPPGPPRLPYVGGIWFFFKDGSLLQSLRFMVEKYGPVSGVFLGNKPFVFISEYETIKEMFKLEELSHRPPNIPNNQSRPGWNTVGPENENRNPGVIGTGGNYWREQRRFLLRNLKDFGFGKSSMESIIQDEMVKLCNRLAKHDENENVSLNRSVNISILNALWFILVGEKLDLEDPQSTNCMSLIDDLFRKVGSSTISLSTLNILLPHSSLAKLPVLENFTGWKRTKKTFKELANFIFPIIEEHKKTLDPNNIRDFMDLMLLEIQNTQNPESSFYGDAGYYALFNDMMDLFLAGMETTTTTLMWTFLFLLHHPDIQEKVHKELDEVVGKNRYPNLEDRPKLHYVNAVLLESLRTASLVGPGVPHYAVKEVKVGNYIIPKDTVVYGSLFHSMYDPKHFENPNKFNPDRFLDESGRFVNNERVVPFGIGKRVCLGQTLAEKEFFIFFTGIVQQFKFVKVESSGLPPYDINLNFPMGGLRSASNYDFRIKKRIQF